MDDNFFRSDRRAAGADSWPLPSRQSGRAAALWHNWPRPAVRQREPHQEKT